VISLDSVFFKIDRGKASLSKKLELAGSFVNSDEPAEPLTAMVEVHPIEPRLKISERNDEDQIGRAAPERHERVLTLREVVLVITMEREPVPSIPAITGFVLP
jgi:hypothetical protein